MLPCKKCADPISFLDAKGLSVSLPLLLEPTGKVKLKCLLPRMRREEVGGGGGRKRKGNGEEKEGGLSSFPRGTFTTLSKECREAF